MFEYGGVTLVVFIQGGQPNPAVVLTGLILELQVPKAVYDLYDFYTLYVPSPANDHDYIYHDSIRSSGDYDVNHYRMEYLASFDDDGDCYEYYDGNQYDH